MDIREISTFLAPECCYVDLVVFEVFQVKSLNIKGGESVVVPVQRDVILQYPKIFNRYLLTVDIFNPFCCLLVVVHLKLKDDSEEYVDVVRMSVHDNVEYPFLLDFSEKKTIMHLTLPY